MTSPAVPWPTHRRKRRQAKDRRLYLRQRRPDADVGHGTRRSRRRPWGDGWADLMEGVTSWTGTRA